MFSGCIPVPAAGDRRETNDCDRRVKVFRKQEGSMSSARAASQNMKAGDVPTTTFGKTGVKVSGVAQGGARRDLHPNVPAAAAHVRRVL